LAAARGLGLIAEDAAAALLERLEAADGEYALGVCFSLDGALVGRALFLDQPELGPDRLRPHLWRVFRRALEIADTAVPSLDPARPCPASLLLTSDAIHLIATQPAEPFSSIRGAGYRFGREGAFVLWQTMLHGHLFIGALLDLREALLLNRRLPDVAAVADRVSGRLLEQIGAVRGTTVDAKYLMLPLLAGTDLCRLHLTFSRGTGDSRIEMTL
jgi:hypothetical protein